MTTAIVPTAQNAAIVAAGQAANHYAALSAFADYLSRKSRNTLRAQRADLAIFAEYVNEAVHEGAAQLRAVPADELTPEQAALLAYIDAGPQLPDADSLQAAPAAWHGVTWGLVAGFRAWMLVKGYAVGSINRHLSTVKVYAKLAAQAGAISAQDAAMLRTVTGYGGTEGKRVDEKRQEAQQATRTGRKKAQHITISYDQAQLLKAQPCTPQGRRDAVLMCLLLDHGLRVGEVAILQVTDFDVRAGTFSFYRPKVDKVQTHRMTADTLRAVAVWLATDAPAAGPLLRGSRKAGKQVERSKRGEKGTKVYGNGKLTEPGMSDRAITARVQELGEAVGLVGLSAHDCRHYWASRAATAGTDAFALRDAGGWSSLAMPSRYVEAATIANERVKL